MTRNRLGAMLALAVLAGMLLTALAGCRQASAPQPGVSDSAARKRNMERMTPTAPMAPPVNGYAQGADILFIHTEASDAEIAKILTDMMSSPVLVVPSLARSTQSMLASVYAFTNGVEGDGPLGFQRDVFDSPPGSNGYSPLRVLNKVTWKNEQSARVLRSTDEVREAAEKGELTIEQTGVVINMPMLTWPGGHR